MKKLLYILFIGLGLSIFTANAADNITGSSKGEFLKVGAAGSQFLKMPVGARGTAIGAYTSMANDISAMYWNPAGLADVKRMSFEGHYTQWFAGFKHIYAGFATPITEQFTLGFNITSFQSDDIAITTLQNQEGTGHHYRVSDIAGGLSFAGYLTNDFSFGINAKYVFNGFSSLSASGIAFDIGTLYNTGIQGIKLGFSMSNLGTKMQYSGQDLRTTAKIIEELRGSPIDAEYISSTYSMPLIFRAGISSEVWKDEDNSVTAAFDFTTLSDTPEQYTLGAEYKFQDLINVRGGYVFGQDQFGLSGGIGLNWDTGSGFKAGFDYSIAPTKDLGLVNRLSIIIGI